MGAVAAVERGTSSNPVRGPFLRHRAESGGGRAKAPVVALDRLVTLIGTRTRCDVCVKGEDVSRRHALILNSGGRLYLRDLSSRTGTYLNGTRVREGYLKDGDVVRVGPAEWEVSGAGAANVVGTVGRTPFPASVCIEGSNVPAMRLHGPVFLIGRRRGSELCLRDARVSAAHAAIVDDGAGWSLVDLVSHDGTSLGELPVASARLNPGDTVRVAGTRFQFRAVEMAVVPPPPQVTLDERHALAVPLGLIADDAPEDEQPSFTDHPSEDYGLNGVKELERRQDQPAPQAAEGPQDDDDALLALAEVVEPEPEIPSEPAAPAESPFAAGEFDLDVLAASDESEELVLERARADLFNEKPPPERAADRPVPPPAVPARPKVTFAPIGPTGAPRPADAPTPPGVTVAMMNPLTLEVIPQPTPARSKAASSRIAGGAALGPAEP